MQITLTMRRDHIARDLEPYVCISEDCIEPLKFFTTFDSWLCHMNDSHTTEWYRKIHTLTWYCDIGKCQRQIFQSRQKFEEHTADQHSYLTPTQHIARLKTCKTVSTRMPLICPLCDCIPPKLDLLRHQPQHTNKLGEILGKHIAHHIKALSLLSFRLIAHRDEDEADGNMAMNSSSSVSIAISENVCEIHQIDLPNKDYSDIEDENLLEPSDVENSLIVNLPELEYYETWSFVRTHHSYGRPYEEDVPKDILDETNPVITPSKSNESVLPLDTAGIAHFMPDVDIVTESQNDNAHNNTAVEPGHERLPTSSLNSVEEHNKM
jgi:hypothetical protein